MSKDMVITPDILHKLLVVDFAEGILTWRSRDSSFFQSPSRFTPDWRANRWNSKCAGRPAAHLGDQGYLTVCVFWKRYQAHRIIFAMKNGRWPSEQLDHVNGQRSDNRIENLIEATNRENCRNQKLRSTNTSGISGVVWNKNEKKWKARINSDNGRINLGTFSDKQSAIDARKSFEALLGYSHVHGVIR